MIKLSQLLTFAVLERLSEKGVHLYTPGRHGFRLAHDTVEPCALSVKLACSSMASWVHAAHDHMEPHEIHPEVSTDSCVHGCAWALKCMDTPSAEVVPWPHEPMQSRPYMGSCPLLVWVHEGTGRPVPGTRCSIQKLGCVCSGGAAKPCCLPSGGKSMSQDICLSPRQPRLQS